MPCHIMLAHMNLVLIDMLQYPLKTILGSPVEGQLRIIIIDGRICDRSCVYL